VVTASGDKIRSLTLDGVAPTAENLEAGRYRLSRASFLVTKATMSPGVERFVAFIRGPDGQRVIRANDGVPGRP
jgi:phosphate transport system substrate-binding protein